MLKRQVDDISIVVLFLSPFPLPFPSFLTHYLSNHPLKHSNNSQHLAFSLFLTLKFFSFSSFSSFNNSYYIQADIDTATEATRQRAATQRRGYEEDMKDMSLKNAELIGEETHTRIACLLAYICMRQIKEGRDEEEFS